MMECLLGSKLPEMGYVVTDSGEGEHILSGAITEKFTLSSSGALVPIAVDSTNVVAMVQCHTGVAKIARYGISLQIWSTCEHNP